MTNKANRAYVQQPALRPTFAKRPRHDQVSFSQDLQSDHSKNTREVHEHVLTATSIDVQSRNLTTLSEKTTRKRKKEVKIIEM